MIMIASLTSSWPGQGFYGLPRCHTCFQLSLSLDSASKIKFGLTAVSTLHQSLDRILPSYCKPSSIFVDFSDCMRTDDISHQWAQQQYFILNWQKKNAASCPVWSAYFSFVNYSRKMFGWSIFLFLFHPPSKVVVFFLFFKEVKTAALPVVFAREATLVCNTYMSCFIYLHQISISNLDKTWKTSWRLGELSQTSVNFITIELKLLKF